MSSVSVNRWFLVFGHPAVAGRVLYLFGHFLGIVSLVFSKFWDGSRNPYEVVRDRAGFLRKRLLPPKLGK